MNLFRFSCFSSKSLRFIYKNSSIQFDISWDHLTRWCNTVVRVNSKEFCISWIIFMFSKQTCHSILMLLLFLALQISFKLISLCLNSIQIFLPLIFGFFCIKPNTMIFKKNITFLKISNWVEPVVPVFRSTNMSEFLFSLLQSSVWNMGL